LKLYDANDVREMLNARASEILSERSEDAYRRFMNFCAEYDESVYKAWYLDTVPGRNEFFDFTLVREVAAGAFGQVYQAEGNGRVVAIKVLHERIRKRLESLQSFRR